MKKIKLRVITILLVFCVIFTGLPIMANTSNVYAAGSYWKKVKAVAGDGETVTAITWSKLTKKQQKKITGIAVFRDGKEVAKLKKTATRYADYDIHTGEHTYQLKTYKKTTKKVKMYYNKKTKAWQTKKIKGAKTKKVKKTWYKFSPEDGKVWWEIGDDVDKKIQSYGSNTRYLIIVKLKEHRVRVYERTDGRWKKIHRWKCTTGKKSTPTPKGTFYIGVKGLHFNTGERSRCWYYTQFYGSYMFHSVLYDRQPRPVNCTRGTLGASLSHGCIRLKLSDAKWLQDHVPAGTKVVIY